jgi:hypothetical protein
VRAALALVILIAAPLAFAQQKPPKKKRGPKPAASASASASASAEPSPDAARPLDDSTPLAPSSGPPDGKSSGAASGEATDQGGKRPDAAATAASTEYAPPVPASNVIESPNVRYAFVGARYRVTVIPQFLVNLFVNEGATFVSHSIGAELDLRKEGQSTIPWIAYTTFGFGDTLFEQNGGMDPTPKDPANWSVVNSSLSALFLGLDELWSAPLDAGRHFEFEFGFGVGIGFVFGSLQNNWVYPDPNGPLHSASYGNYSECTTADPMRPSCVKANHNGATVNKVGGYTEPNWLNGGAVPVVFPHIALPVLGLRYKPIKEFEMRLSTGFSLTGFWAGLSGDYGLEKREGGGQGEGK